jgi:hypothetical protein
VTFHSGTWKSEQNEKEELPSHQILPISNQHPNKSSSKQILHPILNTTIESNPILNSSSHPNPIHPPSRAIHTRPQAACRSSGRVLCSAYGTGCCAWCV